MPDLSTCSTDTSCRLVPDTLRHVLCTTSIQEGTMLKVRRKPNRMSKEARLAYLCHLLHERMMNGKVGRAIWERHFKLTIELEREQTYRQLAALGRVA